MRFSKGSYHSRVAANGVTNQSSDAGFFCRAASLTIAKNLANQVDMANLPWIDQCFAKKSQVVSRILSAVGNHDEGQYRTCRGRHNKQSTNHWVIIHGRATRTACLDHGNTKEFWKSPKHQFSRCWDGNQPMVILRSESIWIQNSLLLSRGREWHPMRPKTFIIHLKMDCLEKEIPIGNYPVWGLC